MEASTFVVGSHLSPRLAKGYANDYLGVGRGAPDPALEPEIEHIGRGYKVPNGGVYSTVADLVRFAGGVMASGGEGLLSDRLREETFAVQTPEDPDNGYGLGFRISKIDHRTFAGHGGSVAGYTAHLLFDLSTGVTVVLLRNYNQGATNLGEVARTLLLELTSTDLPK